MLTQILAWLTVITGSSIMYMAGRANLRKYAWYLGVVNQLVWGGVAYGTRTWGLLGGCVLYGGVYLRNIAKGD